MEILVDLNSSCIRCPLMQHYSGRIPGRASCGAFRPERFWSYTEGPWPPEWCPIRHGPITVRAKKEET